MSKTKRHSVSEGEPLSQGKHRLFTVVMVLIPVLFFGLLEGGLRLVGYGDSYPLFVPVHNIPRYMTQNRDVARRYFTGQERVPASPGDVFLADKDSTVFRLFVQGGSSAAGYPYYYGGSFSRMLEQRLQQTFPGRTIEVVNTAMAAVNSYTMLDFVDEIIARQPDAVLIYAGHNEYYGAMGVGSTKSLGRSRVLVNLSLKLQDVRIVQGLRVLIGKVATGLEGRAPGERPGGTLMEAMVGEQKIPYRARLYRQGLAQFRGNLRDLLARYRAHHIPVFIGTVASNERTHKPFMSGLALGTDEEAWQARYEGALRHVQQGDTSGALTALDALIAVDTLAADAYYAAAQLLDAAGRFPEARRVYLQAKDRDELRFRAPEDVNRIIREEAARAGAAVVETQQALAAVARDGIIGSDLMLEHLHPNVNGYFVIADAFYEALRRAGAVGTWTTVVPASAARREILFTPVDSLFGLYRVRQLMGSWPFRPPGAFDRSMDTVQARTRIEEIALDLYRGKMNWHDATAALRDYYSAEGQYHQALQAALTLIQQYPFVPGAYAAAGEILLRQRRYDEALAYFGATNDLEENAMVHMMIGSIHLAKQGFGDAIEHLERALVLDPQHVRALYQLSRAYQAAGQPERAQATWTRLLEVASETEEGRQLLSTLTRHGTS